MGYKSKYKGSEIDSLLDKAKNDYTVKQYTDYAGYNADTSRPSNTISLIQQDQSIVVGDKRYSQNAECFVGSDVSGISTTGNWFLCGETTFGLYTDVNIIGSAVNTLADGMGGLFVLNLRSDQQSINPNYTFQWLCKVGSDAKTPVLRYVINGMTIKLYCKVFGGQYSRIHIRIFNQVNRTGYAVHKESFFNLKDSTTIIPEADVPSGTDIADVPYITTTAANNKFLPILATTSLVKNNPNVGYVKFAEMDTKGQFGNKAIILAVSTTFVTESNWNDGLYMLNIRGNGTSAPTCRACCFVQYKVSVDKIKLYYAVSGSKVEFYREVRTAKELTQLGFKILHVEDFENGKNWDFKLIESSKTTSDATFDTPIGTLIEIPDRGQVYFADYAGKVQQTNSVLNEERRVLLGGDNDNTQQDNVCKSANLTFNPNTKTLTVPHVSGNSATATKLQTARKIGFADFNGTADVSLNAIQGGNIVSWRSSGTLKPNQWIRIIRMKFTQTWSKVSLTLAIEEIEQVNFRGIINFTAWVTGSINPSVNSSTAIWYNLYQRDRNRFGDVTRYIRMVAIEPTDNDANGYVDVYVMSPGNSTTYGWHIINDRQSNNASFTLKADVTTIIDNENFPTSYKSSGFQGVLATGEDVEYNTWVTKATTATNADVANKTKYPIVFKRNGASITNWFANTTFVIDIPEELLDYSAPTGITLKVPEIDVAKEAKKVANKLSLTVNGSTTEYDGSAGARVSIKANCTHIVKANSSNSLGIIYPGQTGHPSSVTVPISILPLEPYNSAARGLNDGDTLILHVPNSMSNPTANYVWCVKLDITKENTTDNIIPLIHGQSAGTPAYWNTSTPIPAGFYQFVYSATLGGLVYMYRNTATT